MAQYWYNTSFHPRIGTSSFHIILYQQHTKDSPALQELLKGRDTLLQLK